LILGTRASAAGVPEFYQSRRPGPAGQTSRPAETSAEAGPTAAD